MIIYGFFRILFTKHKKQKKIAGTPPTNKALLFSFVVSILLVPLGIWGIDIGANNPWHLFTGVKGPAHGYTLFMLGIVITGFGVFGTLVILWAALQRIQQRL